MEEIAKSIISETVALNKNKQSKFTKTVKNVKDKVNKGVLQVQENITTKKLKPARGLIYVGHIPHGFYEKEMKKYFKQFGTVTKVRVCRSSKTGRSKGYGFVQFLHAEVAQIAAETMDNYLMFNRRLICKYIPPEKQRKNLFKGASWSTTRYPLKLSRKKHVNLRNAAPSSEYSATAKKQIDKLRKKLQKFQALGIEHVFKPDISEDMIHLLKHKDSVSESEHNIKILRKQGESKNSKKAVNDNSIKTMKGALTSNIKKLKTKSLQTIPQKKDTLENSTPHKLSFMQMERLKRLASVEMMNKQVSKKLNKLKKLSKSKIKN